MTISATTTTARVGSKRSASLLPLVIAEPSGRVPLYARDRFGDGWIDANGDCRNTRAQVLIDTTVTRAVVHSCTVVGGTWRDPWTGRTTSDPHKLDIDHTVPLANAWRSGAWQWSAQRRIDYANDVRDPEQLVAIDASENRSKGDSGPQDWRPPLRSAWCRYALVWDHIKAKWGLTATHAEWSALLSMVRTC